MPKNIVLCSDGTGNSAMKGRGTNVFKIYEAIDLNGHKFDKTLTLQQQVAFYDDGVGTESVKFLKVLGGAFGLGLSRNVRQLYAALARCYKPGDHIFLFGFSRGAFTVRQLAGFIIGCGIIDKKHWKTDAELKDLVFKAFRIYRKRYHTWQGNRISRYYTSLENRMSRYHTWLGNRLSKFFPSSKKLREEFRRTYAVKHKDHAPEGKVRIRFIGVWDTVDAVGLPFKDLADFINTIFYRFKFPDKQLNSRVDKACHALSIDDERHSFHPEMWNEEKEERVGRIEQVWFPGVHSNVGGGYPKQGMSLVALDWMMAKAEEKELRFIESVRTSYHEQHNVNDKLYDSRSGMAVYYRYKVRNIGLICSKNHTSVDIHVSGFNRIALGTEGYAPVNFPTGLNLVATDNNPPAAGEDPQSIKTLANKINEALSDNKQLLNKAKKWMVIRRCSHYAFLALTIAIVWFAIKVDSSAAIESTFLNGFLKVAGFIVGTAIIDYLIKPIITHLEIGLTLLELLVLFYLVGLFAKIRIKSVFSRFWLRTLP